MTLRYVSLFDGIGAACVAWKPMGWQCVGKSEIEPFPIAVTTRRQPGVLHLGSVSDITEEQVAALGRVDLIVGGFPCQDLSVAGRRAGLKNDDGTLTRSGLFFDAMRVVRWARRHCGLRWLLIENVPGLYSSNRGRDFAAVVGEMVGADFGVPPDGWRNAGVAVGSDGLLEWATLDAQFFNLAQRRVRVFALADFGDWRSRPPVLFERHSLSGHPAPRREAGQRVAGTIAGCANGGGANGPGRDVDSTDTLVHAPDLARCDATREGSSQDYETTTMIAHALRGEGFDASEDGTGRGTPLVPVVVFQDSEYGVQQYDSAGTLRAGRIPEHQMVMHPVAFHPTQDPISSADVCHALGANANATAAIAFDTAQITSGAIRTRAEPGLPASTLAKQSRMHVAAAMQVRRLTPRECERLQGFPDDYTLVPHRGKPAADGPRYKALGNSMAVPVMRWIGERIQAVEDTCEALEQEVAA